MNNNEKLFQPINFLMIGIGTALYSFGFVEFLMGNNLAEGGLAGVTLILHALFKINPAYTQLIFNIPLLLIGYKYLGKKSFVYTIYATFMMSFFIYIFQEINITIDINNDYLIAALLAGIFSGLGTGIIFRYGGTSGGGDIIAKILEAKKGYQVGRVLLIIDIIVLTASLSYVGIRQIAYTLIASFVYSQVTQLVQDSGYTVRGMLIVTEKYTEISQTILHELERGATFLNGQGAYSGQDKKVIYVVLNPQEIQDAKELIEKIDTNAFISILNINEVIGSGFTYDVRKALKNK